jgi:hypothetical protein
MDDSMRRRPVGSAEQRGLKDVMQETERLLLQLEGLVFPELLSDPSQAGLNASALDSTVAEVKRTLKEAEELVPSERDPMKREVHRKKLESSATRLYDLERRGAQQRRTFKTKSERGQLFAAQHQGDLASYAQEKESLQKSRKRVEEIVEAGVAVLHSLGTQGETIRRAAGKVDDVAGSLGLSNSLMRAVRRRQFGDAALVYGGIIVVTLILYGFYKWTHS